MAGCRRELALKIMLTRNNLRVIIKQKGGDMKSYSSREVRKMLFADGWEEVNCEGDHHQFKHPTKPGKVTLRHPVKDLSVRDLKSIEK